MAPSNVNNAMRATNAAVREWYENADWVDLGDSVTYASATTFTIASDDGTYHANRRIRATDSSSCMARLSSNPSPPNTTVTVTWDSGSLSASLSAVALGATKNNDAEPRGAFELADSDILKADELTAGFTAAVHSAGTKSSGTFTPDPADGNFQHATNDGAHTLGSQRHCSMVVLYKNGSSAGAVTTSGYTIVEGSFSTTNGDEHMCFITRIMMARTRSPLTIKAMQ